MYEQVVQNTYLYVWQFLDIGALSCLDRCRIGASVPTVIPTFKINGKTKFICEISCKDFFGVYYKFTDYGDSYRFKYVVRII